MIESKQYNDPAQSIPPYARKALNPIHLISTAPPKPTHLISSHINSNTKNLKPLLDRLEGLLPGLALLLPKHQLRIQLPVLVDAPRRLHLLVDERVVVLQVGAEALGLQRRPHGQLRHAVALHGPGREAVRVDGVRVLDLLDRGAGGEE